MKKCLFIFFILGACAVVSLCFSETMGIGGFSKNVDALDSFFHSAQQVDLLKNDEECIGYFGNAGFPGEMRYVAVCIKNGKTPVLKFMEFDRTSKSLRTVSTAEISQKLAGDLCAILSQKIAEKLEAVSRIGCDGVCYEFGIRSTDGFKCAGTWCPPKNTVIWQMGRIAMARDVGEVEKISASIDISPKQFSEACKLTLPEGYTFKNPIISKNICGFNGCFYVIISAASDTKKQKLFIYEIDCNLKLKNRFCLESKYENVFTLGNLESLGNGELVFSANTDNDEAKAFVFDTKSKTLKVIDLKCKYFVQIRASKRKGCFYIFGDKNETAQIKLFNSGGKELAAYSKKRPDELMQSFRFSNLVDLEDGNLGLWLQFDDLPDSLKSVKGMYTAKILNSLDSGRFLKLTPDLKFISETKTLKGRFVGYANLKRGSFLILNSASRISREGDIDVYQYTSFKEISTIVPVGKFNCRWEIPTEFVWENAFYILLPNGRRLLKLDSELRTSMSDLDFKLNQVFIKSEYFLDGKLYLLCENVVALSNKQDIELFFLKRDLKNAKAEPIAYLMPPESPVQKIVIFFEQKSRIIVEI